MNERSSSGASSRVTATTSDKEPEVEEVEPPHSLSQTALEERLQAERDATELRLLEQEHRPLRAIFNFLEYQRLGPEDARWRVTAGAAVRALLFRGGLTVTIAGGGLLGAYLLWEQNRLIEAQNRYFQKQTAELREQNQQQIDEAQRARKAQLLSILYDKEDCPNRGSDSHDCPPGSSPRARLDAALEYIALERPRGSGMIDLRQVNFGSPQQSVGAFAAG